MWTQDISLQLVFVYIVLYASFIFVFIFKLIIALHLIPRTHLCQAMVQLKSKGQPQGQLDG